MPQKKHTLLNDPLKVRHAKNTGMIRTEKLKPSSEAPPFVYGCVSRFPDLQLGRNLRLLTPAWPDAMTSCKILAVHSDRIAQDFHLILFYPQIFAALTIFSNYCRRLPGNFQYEIRRFRSPARFSVFFH